MEVIEPSELAALPPHEMDLLLGESLIGVAEGPDYWKDAKRIGQLGARRATRRLMRVVRESAEADRRAAALHALWSLADARATGLFLQVGWDLAGATEQERVIAVEALGVSAHRPFIQQALAGFLRDPAPVVRYSALCAIGRAAVAGGRLRAELRSALADAARDTAKVYQDGDLAELAACVLRSYDGE